MPPYNPSKKFCKHRLVTNWIQSSDSEPLSHQTGMPQRLYSVQKICQRAVGLPRSMPKYFKFASYSVYTTSFSVHTASTGRSYIVHAAYTARKKLLQRAHGAHTAFSRDVAFIALKLFLYIFANIVTFLDCSEQFIHQSTCTKQDFQYVY